MDQIDRLAAWASERHAIYLRRSGQECPNMQEVKTPGLLTDDIIMQNYRFCNVFRELDKVTVWIKENIRERYADDPGLIFMLAIARTVNNPKTLRHLIQTNGAWPSHYNFSTNTLGNALDSWKAQGNKIYSPAYMIRAESNKNASWYDWSKQHYIAGIVIGRLVEHHSYWTTFQDHGYTCQDVWERFQDPHYIGWGPFMSFQVVVDAMHTRLLQDAPDRETWAALGPGSTRGLNRIWGYKLESKIPQDEGLEMMREVSDLMHNSEYFAPWLPKIELLSDIQNCLCEFDKYERARLGQGRPKQLFRGV